MKRDTVNAAFGSVLKGVLRENDLTQQQAADHVGESLVTMQRILNGKREMKVSQFVLIAELCGENPERILDSVMRRLSRVSEVASNVTPLTPKRPASMSDDEIEKLVKAANDDSDNEEPEPDRT